MLQGSPISLYVEVPEQLYDHLQLFLDNNTSWDVDQVMTIALAQFLKGKEKEPLQKSSHQSAATAPRRTSSLAKTAGLDIGGSLLQKWK
ncbi:MAG: DUF2811 domain-containing protein [Cyanophyceae cyanobacterium]